MAKPRKCNNLRLRYERSARAVLSQTRTMVCSTSFGKQYLVSYRTGKKMKASRVIIEALAEIPHQWTIYIAAACRDGSTRYVKAVELATKGFNYSSELGDLVRAAHEELIASCNPKHLISSAWIANTFDVSIDEEKAYQIMDAVGLWTLPESPAINVSDDNQPRALGAVVG